MKKIIAIISVLMLINIQPSQAATKVTFINQNKVSTKNPVVSLTVTGLPKDHGIYISQCMAIPEGETSPKACNPATYSKLWISNVATDQKMGAKSGKSKLTIKVDKYFEGGDCIHAKCIFFITNDHNASADRSEDQSVGFKFSGINLF
jgi:hypothetical protein